MFSRRSLGYYGEVCQHRFNPLHVYCRVVERGANKRVSLVVCWLYEMFIYSWLSWIFKFLTAHKEKTR